MKKKIQQKNQGYSIGKIIFWSIFFGILFMVGISVTVICVWYLGTYNLEFHELLYTLISPLKGTGQSTVSLIIGSCLPWVLAGFFLYLACAVIFAARKPIFRYIRRWGAAFCSLVLVGAIVFSVFALRIPAYVSSLLSRTTIYEEYYVSPDTVSITAKNGKAKNLIYIYLESMETTYASAEDGGMQEQYNYIPNLTELAKQGISFTNKEDASLLGGFHSIYGTTWTMSALLATTAGIPFSFPVSANAMEMREQFAPDLITLGDILEENGYRQEFLCGSDATFGGRKTYFTQHGNYEIFDLYIAREEGYIPQDYYAWWGYEDLYLYEIAKDELLELAAGDQPFNFTMLTVDTHHVDGYRCALCGYEYGYETGEDNLENVLACADAQLAAFVEWVTEQDFFEDCVLVITGDHPRMDTTLIGAAKSYDRTIYNCFFNAAVEPQGATVGREWTSLDMFPTVLAAMGFEIEGDRLGLGTNMFSDKKTLAEELGYAYFNSEVSKYSNYYFVHFS